METNDVFADDVMVHRPPLLEHLIVCAVTDCSDVVGQCVKPHVCDMGFVKRKWDAPRECLAANRKILQTLFDESEYFIDAVIRNNGTRMRRVEVNESLFEA